MKKIFIVTMLLMLLYISLRIGYKYYGNGHNYQYVITTENIDFTINESFTNNKDNSLYYIKIGYGADDFFIQTYYDFKNDSKIIENIYAFDDDKYKCILPVFKNSKIVMDIICKNNNNYYYHYNSLKGINNELDAFATSLQIQGYDVNNWIDSTEHIKNDKLKFYPTNIIGNHYVLLTDYKGVMLLNKNSKKINNIKLFNTDVYQEKLDFIYKNKYVVADYNSKYRFHDFYVIDVNSGDKTTITSDYELSFDSYIQGIIDNKVYLFDRDSKRQYEIDIKQRKVKQVGNSEKGIKIYDFTTKKWNLVSAITASNEVLKFTQEKEISSDYFDKVDSIGTDEFGYYFYFKKVDDKYLVYRSNVQDNSQLVYVFTTSNIDSIIYFYDSVYFIDGDTLNYYSDEHGVRKVVSYDELKFNQNLYFSVYVK